MSDLRERVAMALKDHPLVPFTDDAALTLADAAIALVLEEAAKVCEVVFDSEMASYGDYFAAAIRALKEKSDE